MNQQGIFITGTSTEVGKTVISAGLLRLCINAGMDALPMKPIQTGCEETAIGLSSPDLQFSLEAAGLVLNEEELALASPYRYLPACSPHLAAKLAGNRIEISEITECADQLLQRHELLLVEGAGGVMVPLDESQTMLDLMKVLGYPVLLVAHVGLGTINHALLSLEILRQASLEVLGVVFNTIAPITAEEEFICEDNPKVISSLGKVEVMGALRYLGGIAATDENLWKHFEQDLPGLNKLAERMQND
ncbi:MAG: dethiobiotin synthase [Planctomycetes bacterium]|nr:dethiobiotin synthase [Planctomycetota bacterium]